MKKSCQDLEKNLGKIFSRSCKNLARNQAIQDFCMDLEQESCKIRKILASSKSWHGFGTDFLPTYQILKRLGKILQDIFDRASMTEEDKDLKSSSFDNCRFATLPMLCFRGIPTLRVLPHSNTVCIVSTWLNNDQADIMLYHT